MGTPKIPRIIQSGGVQTQHSEITADDTPEVRVYRKNSRRVLMDIAEQNEANLLWVEEVGCKSFPGQAGEEEEEQSYDGHGDDQDWSQDRNALSEPTRGLGGDWFGFNENQEANEGSDGASDDSDTENEDYSAQQKRKSHLQPISFFNRADLISSPVELMQQGKHKHSQKISDINVLVAHQLKSQRRKVPNRHQLSLHAKSMHPTIVASSDEENEVVLNEGTLKRNKGGAWRSLSDSTC